MTLNKKLLAVSFLIISIAVKAQPFGFGCLGLSGFYAGYAREAYDADGINEFVKNSFLSFPANTILTNEIVEFKQGGGYRIGANLFRAKFDKIFFSAKGFYQFLREEHETSGQVAAGIIQKKYQLTMNHWGAGVDFGISLISIIDWKIVEANVTFFNSEFGYQEYLDNVLNKEEKYNPDKVKMGYFIGSGLIIHLIPDYISVEGTAGYHFIQIEKMTSEGGLTIPIQSSTKKAIANVGFSAIIQLNVGFPL